jgi:hypothetical protein
MRPLFVLVTLVVSGFVAVSLSSLVVAAVVWDEQTNGDLSNDRSVPTSIALSAGTNSLRAVMPISDLDYFTIVVPSGHELSSLVLASYVGDDNVAFVGVQQGTQMTVPPTTFTAEGLLGWTHFGDGFGQVGANILPDIGNGFGASGFIPPLASGPYTFWIQQLDGTSVSLQFDFQVMALAGENLAGDFDGSHSVANGDLTLLLDNWGKPVPSVPTGWTGFQPTAPAIGNDELTALLDHWGQTGGAGSLAIGVPEPTSLVLFGVAGIVALATRRR